MHAEAIRGAGNAQQNFICVILSSRGRRIRRIRRKLKRLLTNCQKKAGQFLLKSERESETDRESRKKSRKVSSETKLRVLNSP